MNAYRELAKDLLDYLLVCNKHRAVPTMWDVNHYTSRLHEVERKETPRRKRID